jgi:small-conductance mechanosensitive channel
VGGYAVHEHNAAKTLAAQNEQITAALSADRNALNDLTAKVNALAARSEAPPAQPAATVASTPARPTASAKPSAGTPRRRAEDPRLKKLQSQIDTQGKEIEETRNDLASTQGNLDNTRTELTGSIARTHDELVVLEKKGERSYFEFDIAKSKEFQRNGPFGIRLRKANVKHQYADLELMVDDRSLTQKHVNLYQPVMFYTPDTPQAAEVVINAISKDHIHGYVSAPKYTKSELLSMSNAGANPAPGSDQAATNSNQQSAQRQKLTVPQQ